MATPLHLSGVADLAGGLDLTLAAAVLAAAAAASATLSPRWRLRLRGALLGYAALGLLLAHGPAEVVRLLAVAAGLAVGPLVASVVRPGRQPAGADGRGGRPAAAALDAEVQRSAVQQLLRTVGSTNRLAWMTTWPRNRWYHGTTVRGYLAHQVHAGVAIGLCDPVAANDDDRARVLDEFAARADRRGLTPCLVAVTAGTAAAAVEKGWRVMPVGEEAVVDLPGLSFHGRAWQDVRTALNQGARRGISVVSGSWDSLPLAVRSQVAETSKGWTCARRLPELGFTLGGLDEAADPQVRMAVAVDEWGVVHGVVSWLPSYRPSDGTVVGWTLDLMRRRAGSPGFRPVMELLIATSLLRFRDEGCAWASLSASPLSHLVGDRGTDSGPARVDRLLLAVAERLEPFYGFRSLHAFKAKFSPRFEPLYLAYPSDAALPRISVALARAYLPDARLRDLAALRTGHLHQERPVAATEPVATARAASALVAAAASSGSSDTQVRGSLALPLASRGTRHPAAAAVTSGAVR